VGPIPFLMTAGNVACTRPRPGETPVLRICPGGDASGSPRKSPTLDDALFEAVGVAGDGTGLGAAEQLPSNSFPETRTDGAPSATHVASADSQLRRGSHNSFDGIHRIPGFPIDWGGGLIGSAGSRSRPPRPVSALF
jgi:hypothetical protein